VALEEPTFLGMIMRFRPVKLQRLVPSCYRLGEDYRQHDFFFGEQRLRVGGDF